jgi:hypothetical protein
LPCIRRFKIQLKRRPSNWYMVLPGEAVLPGEVAPLHKLMDPTNLRAVARGHNEAAQHRQKAYHDQRRRPAQVFVVGSWAYVYNKRMHPGFSSKLLPRFTGPFQVIQRLGESTYRLRNPVSGHRHHFSSNASEMKRFIPDADIGM